MRDMTVENLEPESSWSIGAGRLESKVSQNLCLWELQPRAQKLTCTPAVRHLTFWHYSGPVFSPFFLDLEPHASLAAICTLKATLIGKANTILNALFVVCERPRKLSLTLRA